MEGNVYPLIDYFNSRGHELDSSNTEALNHVWEGSIEVFKSGPMFHPKKCLSLDALLLGDPDSQEVFLPSAREEVAGIASQLLGHRESSISVGPLDLMLHAHTKPIRAGIRIDSADNNIEGKIYLKIFDPTRVFGIQLYNLLAGIGVDYHFVTDDELTVEEEVGGNHLFDLEDSKRSSLNRSPLFTSQRIALDSYRINLGFGDLVKESPYSHNSMVNAIIDNILDQSITFVATDLDFVYVASRPKEPNDHRVNNRDFIYPEVLDSVDTILRADRRMSKYKLDLEEIAKHLNCENEDRSLVLKLRLINRGLKRLKERYSI